MASWKDTAASASLIADQREQEAEGLHSRAEGAETEQERQDYQRQAESAEREANDHFQQSTAAKHEAEREATQDEQQKELQEAEQAAEDWQPSEIEGSSPAVGEGLFDKMTGDIVQGAEEHFNERGNEQDRVKLEEGLNEATPIEPEPEPER